MILSEAINIVINECTGIQLAKQCDKAYQECKDLQNKTQINEIILSYINKILNSPNEIIKTTNGFDLNIFTDKNKDIWLANFINSSEAPDNFKTDFINLFNIKLKEKTDLFNKENKNLNIEKAKIAQKDFHNYQKEKLKKLKTKTTEIKHKIYG